LIGCVADNDILYKGTCYQFLRELLQAVATNERFGILGEARYVVGGKLRKRPPRRGGAAAIADFERELSSLQFLEPTPEEVAVAAELELAAQQLAVALDSGESLLVAVTHMRRLLRLFTGDKRAAEALEALLRRGIAEVQGVAGKLVCLEQGVAWMLKLGFVSATDCRRAVCADKTVDIALAICFSCSSPEIADERCQEGLRAYIESLRATAPNLLADG